jgi:ribosome-binding factor A
MKTSGKRPQKTQGPKPSRAHRVAGLLKAELMELLLRGGVRDKALTDTYITDVAFTDDLRHARVYFRLTRSIVSDKDRENALSALEKASGYLRRELGPRLRLQYMPDLKFFWDDGLDRAARVEAVLAEIRRDEEGEP